MMVVTAHPDDEAGGFGGTLAAYKERGVETSVICLTPGQAASNRGNAKDDHELAAMRKKEFAASCEALGVTRPVILDYPDGQLYRQELNRVVYEITLNIRQFRPHVMLTFGPEGGVTGHPDHSMAGIFASLAFQWAGRSNRYGDQLQSGMEPHRTQKLYYGTADFALPGRQPIALSPPTAVIDIAKHLETKIKAFKMNSTQSPLWPLFEQNARQVGQKEMFHLISWVKSGPIKQETDLFQDVDE